MSTEVTDRSPPAPGARSAPGLVIARAAIFEQLLDAVREMIVSGELPQGSRIGEPELCERFGISRTPLREVFKVLASEGLVELQTFRGAFVARVSEEDALEVACVLSALEQAAARLVCGLASDDAIAALEETTRAMVAAADAGDMGKYRRLNESIHNGFVEQAGNAVLRDCYNRIKNRLLRARHAGTRTSEELRRAIDEHQMMMDALRARDGDRLAGIIERHYRV